MTKNITTKDDYYNSIATGYNELHGEEQIKKMKLIKKNFGVKSNNNLLLDIGCGTGFSSNWDCKVVGLDPNKKLLIQNKNTICNVIGGGDFLPFCDKSFDYCVSLTAIHHVKDITKAISEIKRVCKKKAIISFLKRSSKREILEKEIEKNFEVEKKFEEERDIIYILNP